MLTGTLKTLGLSISVAGLEIDRDLAKGIMKTVITLGRAGERADNICRAVDRVVGHLVGFEPAASVAQRTREAVAREFGRQGMRVAGCCASDRLTIPTCQGCGAH